MKAMDIQKEICPIYRNQGVELKHSRMEANGHLRVFEKLMDGSSLRTALIKSVWSVSLSNAPRSYANSHGLSPGHIVLSACHDPRCHEFLHAMSQDVRPRAGLLMRRAFVAVHLW